MQRKRDVQLVTQNKIPSWQKPKLKVCGYVRVSTKHELQVNSSDNQVQYYTRYISSNPDYEFCGIFTDTGVSGAKERRPGFDMMLDKARAGMIDLIITKSISRFARNTILLLETIRELKSLGVAVYFEEQHINTLSAQGELMLTVLASFAQEERKTVCTNLRWAIRNRYKQGITMIDTNRLLGYDKDKDGNLVINEEEAKIVRLIYNRYLSGTSAELIALELEENNVPTYTNYPWSGHRIIRIISNEKYKGDVLMQKTFVDDNGKSLKNKGQCSKYYIKDDHEPIVSKSDWERACRIRQERSRKMYPFSGRLHCPLCGAILIRTKTQWGVDWICSRYLNFTKEACRGIRIPDDILHNISSKEHLQGHWIVKEEANGQEDKRKKSYYLVPENM